MPGAPIVRVAARQGQGIDGVEAHLVTAAAGARPAESSGLITNARHLAALGRAQSALQRARDAARAHASPELIVVEVDEVVDQLGQITGQTVDDRLLDEIFSQFCIGK